MLSSMKLSTFSFIEETIVVCKRCDFSLADFLSPQVVRARKKDTGNVYALKIMDKKFITKENKIPYVKLERIVLDQLDHPGIIRLYFTFQDTYSLCKCSHLAHLFHLRVFRTCMVCRIS